MVITGLIRSGKSSLAFDAIYAGCTVIWRVLIRIASILGTMDKPDVDSIEGLGQRFQLIKKSGQPQPAWSAQSTV